MDSIKKISVREFIDKGADVSFYSMLKAKNLFCSKSFDYNTVEYEKIKLCLKNLSKEITPEILKNVFCLCYDITEADFYAADLSEFFPAKLFLEKTFKTIVENENKMFASYSADSALWDQAGSERLRPFDYLMPLIHLGKAFGQYPFDLGKKPYGEIISLLYALKVSGDIENEFLKLKQK